MDGMTKEEPVCKEWIRIDKIKQSDMIENDRDMSSEQKCGKKKIGTTTTKNLLTSIPLKTRSLSRRQVMDRVP